MTVVNPLSARNHQHQLSFNPANSTNSKSSKTVARVKNMIFGGKMFSSFNKFFQLIFQVQCKILLNIILHLIVCSLHIHCTNSD